MIYAEHFPLLCPKFSKGYRQPDCLVLTTNIAKEKIEQTLLYSKEITCIHQKWILNFCKEVSAMLLNLVLVFFDLTLATSSAAYDVLRKRSQSSPFRNFCRSNVIFQLIVQMVLVMATHFRKLLLARNTKFSQNASNLRCSI